MCYRAQIYKQSAKPNQVMKDFIPQIRIISVDHDKTITAMQRLHRSMEKHGLIKHSVREVFCHLEAGRCGVKSGYVAIEVEGMIIWKGQELTEKLAEQFAEGLPKFIDTYCKQLGI